MAKNTGKGKRDTVQTVAKDAVPVDPMAALVGMTSAPRNNQAEKPKASKRPTIMLSGKQATSQDAYAAINEVTKHMESLAGLHKTEVLETGVGEWIRLALLNKAQPENPRLVTDKSSSIYQMVSKFTVVVPEGQALRDALVSAQVRDTVAGKIAMKVTRKIETTIFPLQEYATPVNIKGVLHLVVVATQPEKKELVEKLDAFFQTLSQDERQELFVTKSTFEVSPEFIGTAAAEAKDANELEAILSVVKPQRKIGSTDFNGGFDAAVEYIKTLTKPATPVEEVGKVKTVTKTVETTTKLAA